MPCGRSQPIASLIAFRAGVFAAIATFGVLAMEVALVAVVPLAGGDEIG
jgi:hypothetical protein